MGARPVEDRERLTPARPGLFVAAARVREEHGRGFPRERGRKAATNTAVGPGGRACERKRERERNRRMDGVGKEREIEGCSVSDDGGGREEAVSMARATTR